MHRRAVDQHRTRAAIACVATGLHLEPAAFPQKRPQALSRPRITVHRNAVDDDAHWCTILVSVIFFEGFLVHHPVCR
jgi:hypothetical protein